MVVVWDLNPDPYRVNAVLTHFVKGVIVFVAINLMSS